MKIKNYEKSLRKMYAAEDCGDNEESVHFHSDAEQLIFLVIFLFDFSLIRFPQ